MRLIIVVAAMLALFNPIKMNAQQQVYSLDFDANTYTLQTFTFNGKEYQVRAFENIVYVANPVDTAYQKINIYVPEEYFHGERVGKYSRDTAPIFYPDGVGG